MSESFSTALMLMAVGMITVFLILALIVSIGNLLIRFVNRFFPEEILEKISEDLSEAGTVSEKVAVIAAVVDVVTAGEGRVAEIKRKK